MTAMGSKIVQPEWRLWGGKLQLDLYGQRMKLELMQVGERLSLEMDPPGLDAVRSFIKQNYPDMTNHTAGIVTSVRFGGAEFIFENEWDAPYLLSNSSDGDELLRSICRHIGK